MICPVAEAKAFAVEVASDLFSLSGASAADQRYDLSRHWRNARTHASHDPVEWKYHHVGTGVTVVTSVAADGRLAGTTANAVSSLSLDPPLVLACFDRTSLTLDAVRSHGAFVINVLSAPQRQLSANFARRGLAAHQDLRLKTDSPACAPAHRHVSS